MKKRGFRGLRAGEDPRAPRGGGRRPPPGRVPPRHAQSMQPCSKLFFLPSDAIRSKTTSFAAFSIFVHPCLSRSQQRGGPWGITGAKVGGRGRGGTPPGGGRSVHAGAPVPTLYARARARNGKQNAPRTSSCSSRSRVVRFVSRFSRARCRVLSLSWAPWPRDRPKKCHFGGSRGGTGI